MPTTDLRRSRRSQGLPPESTSDLESPSSEQPQILVSSTTPPPILPMSNSPNSNSINTPPAPEPDANTQMASMAQIIMDLQQMVHDLKNELRQSHQETAKVQQAFLDFVSQQSSSQPLPSQIPSSSPQVPVSTSSTPNASATSPSKKSSISHLMIKSMQNQEHLLETFINAQNNQFLTMQQMKRDKAPTSSVFPKFTGKSRDEFIKWETNVLNILATDDWSDLYDFSSQDAVSSGTLNSKLNNHLYKNISNQLGGSAKTIMDAKTHLRGDGIALLQALRLTYKATLNNVTLSNKFAELTGGSYFRAQSEDIDTYAARTITLAKDLNDNGWPVTPMILKNSFIMGLGPGFTDIIEKHNTNKLPPEWLSHDLNDLIVPAKDHLDLKLAIRTHNKNYKQHFSQTTTNPTTPSDATTTTSTNSSQRVISPQAADRQHRIRLAIESGTYKESNFTSEVKPNCCIWHNTNHISSMCWVLRNLLRKHNPTAPPPTVPTSVNPLPPSSTTVVSRLTANSRPNPLPNAPPSQQQYRYPQSNATDTTQLTHQQHWYPKTNTTAPTQQPQAHIAKGSSPTPCSATTAADSVPSSHLTFPDVVEINTQLSNLDDYDLNNKNDPNPYSFFSLLANNNLPSTPNPILPPPTPQRFILDSGAYPSMMYDNQFFTTLTPISSSPNNVVTLADGNTKAPILGIGTVRFKTFNKVIELHDVLYVPSLHFHLYSIKSHISYQKCFIFGKNHRIKLGFAHFAVNSLTSNNDFYLPIIPTTDPPHFSTIHCPQLSNPDHTAIARLLQRPSKLIPHPLPINLSHPLPSESPELISTTDPHLPLDDTSQSPQTHSKLHPTQKSPPTSFSSQPPPPRHSTLPTWIDHNTKVIVKLPSMPSFQRGTIYHQNEFYYFQPISSNRKYTLSYDDLLTLHQQNLILKGHNHHITKPPPSPKSLPQHIHSVNSTSVPLRTEDEPLSSWPKHRSFTYDQLRTAFGFRNINKILPMLKQTSQPTFSLSSTDTEPIIDLGSVATIKTPSRNTTPLSLPPKFGDLFHCDIVYGSETAYEGIRYALIMVDRATCYKVIYPLTNLTDDISNALERFYSTFRMFPKILRSDYDKKLIGTKIEAFLQKHNLQCQLQGAPPETQNKNGLSESNWKYLLKMSRAWLATHLLPSKFWWWALKRAVETSNYVPIKIDTHITTPFYLVHHVKPDLRNLLPLFSVSYLTRYRDGNKKRQNMHSQTIRAILVGRDEKADAFKFFHPGTQRTIVSDRFKIDEVLTSGPTFGLQYDGGFYFNKYDDFNDTLRPPRFKPDQTVYIVTADPPIPAKILTIPTTDANIYTIQLQSDLSIHQYPGHDLLEYDPTSTIHDDQQPSKSLPKWICHDSKITLFLNNMTKPKYGTLQFQNNQWSFRQGYKPDNPSQLLPDFHAQIPHLLSTHQIFKGHQKFEKLLHLRQSRMLALAVASHISAANLTSEDLPTLKQFKNLCPNDRKIWGDAYFEEYDDLYTLPCWDLISEKQYEAIKHLCPYILPTMAVSTIKYDEYGNKKRAKFRIVALGNLEKHTWDKSDVFAPVLSLMELRLLIAIAVKYNRIAKNGDVKQAFVQAFLPPDEMYVMRPPPGCPYTPPNHYWLLKRTLYGLKRSPKHWYDKAVKILASIGIHKCPNSTCLFSGRLRPDLPPLYLGLYVDDFIYFSPSDETEKLFEQRLQQHTTVDFMGKVTHFIGHQITWEQHDNTTVAHLSQTAYIESILNNLDIDIDSINHIKTPYRSGLPVDSIKSQQLSKDQFIHLQSKYRSILGSLNWLAQGSRPDIAVIHSLLAKYQNNPSPGHLTAAIHVLKYLRNTKHLGISFHTNEELTLQSFIHFPIKSLRAIAFSDANWGPQDSSVPKPDNKEQLDLFKTRSMSGYLIKLHGPLHWSAGRQKITARSTAQAEIYATDECTKTILQLHHIIQDLGLRSDLTQLPTKIFNDNMACIQWSRNKTSRNIRHIQIKENAVRESVQNKEIQVCHIGGKINPADIFTKEDKDTSHFVLLRDIVLSPPPKKSSP